MTHIRRSNERGHAHHGWLDSYHTFSFAEYHDPKHVQFRALRVINEDVVAPEQGFGMHPHRDMEIITYVVSGALQHRDSMGNTAIMRGGDVQRISAGTGILHSEFNASASEPVHLLQIWITPDQARVEPGYAEKSFAAVTPGKLHLVASKAGRDGSIPINQEADLFLGKLKAGETVAHRLKTGRHAWLQLIKGAVEVDGAKLGAGDAASFSDVSSITIAAGEPSEFLFFDLN
jgi:redox-sensitive bicupin YhaK (pirin superfamily)